jgi:hypothetical protein
VVAVAILAFLAYYVLDYFGFAWAIWPAAILFGVLWLGEAVLTARRRKKREDDWDRWERAVHDDAARPEAIKEVREAIKAARRLGPRLRLDVAHLSVILAELHDASGKPLEGARVLSQVSVEELEKAQAAVVRHAKVVCYLSAGDLENAENALAVRDAASGAEDIDVRLTLLGLMIALEKGEAERALSEAEKLGEGADPEVQIEAIVVQAAALDALGKRDEAIARLDRIDGTTLDDLARLGQPRIRPLAKEAAERARK